MFLPDKISDACFQISALFLCSGDNLRARTIHVWWLNLNQELISVLEFTK